MAGQPGGKGVAQIIAQAPATAIRSQQRYSFCREVWGSHAYPTAGHGGGPMLPKHLLDDVHYCLLGFYLNPGKGS